MMNANIAGMRHPGTCGEKIMIGRDGIGNLALPKPPQGLARCGVSSCHLEKIWDKTFT